MIRRALALALLLAAPASAAQFTEQRAFRAGLDAYVYGLPPVLSQLTADRIPPQTLLNINAIATPENRVIVQPNVDTPYTVANLDLAAEPLVLHVPAITDRYYVFQFLDAFTNTIGYVGTRTTGSATGDYALTGPDFDGELPPGMGRIDSPTNRIVIVGRTLLLGDMPVVREIQARYGLTPLSAVLAGEPSRPGPILDAAPALPPPTVPEGLAFFDLLGDVLAAQAPPASDARLLGHLRRFGIGPGLHPGEAALPEAVLRGLRHAANAGPRHVDRLVGAFRRKAREKGDGWAVQTDIGAYGTDFELRAIVAEVGLWANTAEEAIYPVAEQDVRGRRLSGRHRYVLRFAPGELPPAREFWSLTMYEADYGLYANELDRYALGDRSEGLVRDPDGGLTILLQHERPGEGRLGNWLPAPARRFVVTLRLYDPAPRALDGRWRPPGVRRIG